MTFLRPPRTTHEHAQTCQTQHPQEHEKETCKTVRGQEEKNERKTQSSRVHLEVDTMGTVPLAPRYVRVFYSSAWQGADGGATAAMCTANGACTCASESC